MSGKVLEVPDWARARIQQRLETGGVIVSLRSRGYCWDDLADAFGLADANQARRLAVHYLLASSAARPPENAQDTRDPDPLR